MKNDQAPTSVAEFLEDIAQRALADNGGCAEWQQWKANALESVIRLAQEAPRFELLEASLQGDLHLVYRIAQPTPRWPVDGQLVVGDVAVFHLHYVEQWLCDPPHGWEPVGILYPPDVFHPNCRPAMRGAICLGELPAGVLVEELIHLGYQTLALQLCTLDPRDPHGVLNEIACEFFRDSRYRPLTPVGLLEPWDGGVT